MNNLNELKIKIENKIKDCFHENQVAEPSPRFFNDKTPDMFLEAINDSLAIANEYMTKYGNQDKEEIISFIQETALREKKNNLFNKK